MATVDVDSLQVSITSDATRAANAIKSLTSKLDDLKTACSGGCGLRSIVAELNSMKGALKSLDGSSGQKLQNLAAGLASLKGVGKVTIDANLATQLSNLNLVVSGISADAGSKLQSFAAGLNGLSGVGKISISSTLGRHLGEIADAAQRFSNGAGAMTQMTQMLGNLAHTDMPKISSSLPKHLQEMADAIERMGQLNLSSVTALGTAMESLHRGTVSTTSIRNLTLLADAAERLNGRNFTGIRQLAQYMQQLARTITPLAPALNNLSSALNQNSQSTQQAGRAASQSGMGFMNLYAAVQLARNSIRVVSRTLSGWIDKSNKYIENVNLFTVSMGEYAESARKYAEQVGEIMGIDPGAWMRNQGVFQTLSTGFGVTADRAAVMSKNLTQLGYDLSSFFNIAVDGEGGAMQKLQAGLSGELEPLRRLGFDLSEARLKAVAAELGIKKTYKAMNQAEKAQLRYYAIMNQVTTAQGDMARTLDTPANQLRILQAQVEQAARALGNIFIPVLNAVLPYLIAVAKAVRIVAQSIAEFFGFKMPEIDYSGVTAAADDSEKLSDNLGTAGKNAKKLNELLADWDELNIIASESGSNSSGSGAGANGSGGFDFDLPEYDFLGGLADSLGGGVFEKMKPTVEWIQAHLESLLHVAEALGIAFLAWKISKVFTGDLGTLFKQALGLAVAVYGATQAFDDLKDQWENGVNVDNMIKLIADMGLVVLGLGIAFGITGFGIGLVLEGLALAIAPLKEWYETGQLTEEAANQLGIAFIFLAAGITLLKTGSVKAALGIAIAAYGIVESIKAIKEQWENGVTFENMKDLFVKLGIVALGLFVAFGMTGFAIGLVIAGVAAAVAPIKELIETGNMCEESFTQLEIAVGLLGVGLGLLTGSWIPLLIAAVAEIALLVIQHWDEIKAYWDNVVVPFFKSIWDWIDTNVIQPIVNGVIGLYNSVTAWVESTYNTVSKWVSDLCNSVVTWVSNAYNDVVSWIVSAYESVTQWVSDTVNAVVGWVETAYNSVVQWVTDLYNSVVGWVISTYNSVVAWFTNLANGVIDAVHAVSNWWTGTAIPWVQGIIGWIDENIVQKVIYFFESIYLGIVKDIENFGVWWNQTALPWINGVLLWITQHIVDPVITAFTGIYNGIVAALRNIGTWWTGTVIPWFEAKIEWIIANVVDPVVSWFETLVEWVTDAVAAVGTWWTDTVVPWFEGKIQWIRDNVITPVYTLFCAIPGMIQTAVASVKSWWNDTVVVWFNDKVKWVQDNVITPVGEFFGRIPGLIEDGVSAVGSWWNDTVMPWVTDKVGWIEKNLLDPVKSIAKNIYNSFKTWLDKIRTEGLFTGTVEIFKKAFRNLSTWFEVHVTKPLSDFFTGMINGMIDAINWVIDKMNMLGLNIGKVQRIGENTASSGSSSSKSFGTGVPNVPDWKPVDPGLGSGWYMKTYASGGFPEVGQMFMAREEGPELIGTIGGRSAVANNDDIESGIADGVREANSEQNALLQAGINYLRIIAARSGNSGGFGPSVELGRIVKRSEELRLQAEGV